MTEEAKREAERIVELDTSIPKFAERPDRVDTPYGDIVYELWVYDKEPSLAIRVYNHKAAAGLIAEFRNAAPLVARWALDLREENRRLLADIDTYKREAAINERDEAGLREENERLRTEKDGAYSERNRLVAYLASLFPSVLERHPEDEEWEDDWRWIVFIHHPNGQLSWHIHDSELPLFSHVPRGEGHVKWDGHTTEEKYERLLDALRSGESE